MIEYTKGEYTLSTDPGKLDINVIHGYLTHSYWCSGISVDQVAKGIKNSLCFGMYYKSHQIGFARVITDYARFAYLADVFILDPYQGIGLSKWLMEKITTHPELQGISRFMLATKDAHGLYKKFCFQALNNPEMMMEKVNHSVYKKNN